MEQNCRLSITLVTWNSERYLPDLFPSLDAQTSREYAVSVVDNASTDGTLEWLRTSRPTVPVLRNYRNQGFARGHNQGMALGLRRWESEENLSRRYVMMLNPDTILHPNAVSEILAFMDAHPDVAIAAPKLLRAIRRSTDGGSNDIERTNIIDSTGLSLRKSRAIVDRGAGEEDRGQYDGVDPFGVSGAAMVIRASSIQDLSLSGEVFDEDFHSYKEDGDLCWRARLFGCSIAMIPKAIVWHFRAVRAPKASPIVALFRLCSATWRRPASIVRQSRRNQIWMEWKNDDVGTRLIHAPWIMFRFLLACGANILVPSYLGATLEAFRGRSLIRKKRKEIIAKRKIDPKGMRKWFVGKK